MQRTFPKLLVLLVASMSWASPAFSQGADDCANAQPISGLGVFAFDNTTATTDGAADCDGNFPVRRDVWFQWTAATTAGVNINTCGAQAAFATRLGVYEGTACPAGAPIDCNSNNCGTDASINFQAIAGQTYLFRVGSRPVGVFGTGTFTLADICPGTNDDAFEENDVCASAVPIQDGTYPGLYVNKGDPDYFSFAVAPGSTLTVNIAFTHSTGDVDLYLWEACGGVSLDTGTSATDNENLNWTNNTGSPVTAVMRLEHWLADQNGDCQTYTMTVSGVGGCTTCDLGTRYCTPASNNSTGAPGVLTLSGSDVASDDNLTLVADGLPPNITGYFVAGMGNNTFTPPGAAGSLCVGGMGLARFVPPISSGANGQMGTSPFLTNVPRFGAIMAGDTLNFQCWYQDGSTSNFTDAVELTFN